MTREAAVQRLALVFANARSDKELPPPYDSLDECPDAAHFVELAELAMDMAVIPIVQDLDARWIKMASADNSWQPLDPKDYAWWTICSD